MMLPALLESHTIIYCFVQMWFIRQLSYLTALYHCTWLSFSSMLLPAVWLLFLAILAKVQYATVILQLTKVKGVCSFVVVV